MAKIPTFSKNCISNRTSLVSLFPNFLTFICSGDLQGISEIMHMLSASEASQTLIHNCYLYSSLWCSQAILFYLIEEGYFKGSKLFSFFYWKLCYKNAKWWLWFNFLLRNPLPSRVHNDKWKSAHFLSSKIVKQN